MNREVRIRIRDWETWLKFKEFVISKHGKLHSALSDELTEALAHYMHTRTSSKQSNPNPNSRIAKELSKLKEAILEKVEVGGSIPKPMLTSIIKQACNVYDERAVRSRIHALLASHFLKPDLKLDPDGNIFRVIGGDPN